MRFDLIVIVPLIPPHYGFSFVFGCGGILFGEIQCLPVDAVQQLVVIPVLSQERVNARPSTLPS